MPETTVQDLYELATKLTTADLTPVTEELGLKNPCTFCHQGQYEIAENDGMLMAVATPIAPSNERALWFYAGVCNHCAHTIFFLAPNLVEKVIAYRDRIKNEQ